MPVHFTTDPNHSWWERVRTSLSEIKMDDVKNFVGQNYHIGLALVGVAIVGYMVHRQLKQRGIEYKQLPGLAWQGAKQAAEAFAVFVGLKKAAENPVPQQPHGGGGGGGGGGGRLPADPNAKTRAGKDEVPVQSVSRKKEGPSSPGKASSADSTVVSEEQLLVELQKIEEDLNQKQLSRSVLDDILLKLAPIYKRKDLSTAVYKQVEELVPRALMCLTAGYKPPIRYKLSEDGSTIEVPGDGNCGFYAIHAALKQLSFEELPLESTLGQLAQSSSADFALTLRGQVVDHEKELYAEDIMLQFTVHAAIENEIVSAVFLLFQRMMTIEELGKSAGEEDTQLKQNLASQYVDTSDHWMHDPYESPSTVLDLYNRFKETYPTGQPAAEELLRSSVQRKLRPVWDADSDAATDIVDKYFTFMKQPGKFAQLPELYSFSDLYKMPVVAITNNRDAVVAKVQAGIIDDIKVDEAIIFGREHFGLSAPVVIQNLHGNHYDVPSGSGSGDGSSVEVEGAKPGSPRCK